MKETFDDSAKMLEDYQGAQSPPPASESDQSKWTDLTLIVLVPGHLDDHCPLEPDLPRRVSPGTRKTLENYSRIVKWATRDKKRLENLIQTLTKYNNDLDRLATTVEQASMRRRWRTQFMAPRQLEDLRTLQEAATLTGHDDLYREASSKAFVQEVYESEDVCAKLQSTQLQAITEPVTDVSESLDSWKLEFKRLHLEGVAIMAHNMRTLAEYAFETGKKDAILVDWSRCRDDSWRRHNPGAFQIRVCNLARVLNRDLLPKGFRVLQCIGYVHASSTTIGYIYRPPVEALPGQDPVSLHHILKKVNGPSDIPELGVRFELAKAIITTVFEFHNVGWLHKNIQPENILFWPRKDLGGELDLRKPYLVGFDLSRSNQPGEITEKPISSEGEDLYRHPSYKGPQATGFKPAYDYYSLSIVLFEIAMWRLVSKTSSKDGADRRKASLADPDFVHRTVIGVTQDLGRYIGARYRDAVLATINLEFDDIWEAAEEDRRDLALQQAFQSKVVDAIDFCQA